MKSKVGSPLDGGSLPGRGWWRTRGWRVNGGEVSKGRLGGEEEGRFDGLKPQIDGVERSGERRAGEEMSGCVRMRVAMGAGIGWGSANAV